MQINVNLSLIVWTLLYAYGFGQTNVQLDPTSFGNRCPGEVITFTCTTIGSPIIAWISDEYIAPGGVQLAFATVDTIGDTETSSRYLSTVATLTGNLLASQTLTSTLQLTVSAEYQVSSVTCVNVGSGDQQSANITSLGEAEALDSVKSILRREPNNMCAVDLSWELPLTSSSDDVSHFMVTVNNDTMNETSTTSSYTMCVCEPHNVTISLVDRCGRISSSTSVITFNTTQPLFECEFETTSTSEPITNDGCRFDLNDPVIRGTVVVAIVVIVVIVLICTLVMVSTCLICYFKYGRGKGNGVAPEGSEKGSEKNGTTSTAQQQQGTVDDFTDQDDNMNYGSRENLVESQNNKKVRKRGEEKFDLSMFEPKKTKEDEVIPRTTI